MNTLVLLLYQLHMHQIAPHLSSPHVCFLAILQVPNQSPVLPIYSQALQYCHQFDPIYAIKHSIYNYYYYASSFFDT